MLSQNFKKVRRELEEALDDYQRAYEDGRGILHQLRVDEDLQKALVKMLQEIG